jgi:hypothetical protein
MRLNDYNIRRSPFIRQQENFSVNGVLLITSVGYFGTGSVETISCQSSTLLVQESKINSNVAAVIGRDARFVARNVSLPPLGPVSKVEGKQILEKWISLAPEYGAVGATKVTRENPAN